jgi:hypothetical protein
MVGGRGLVSPGRALARLGGKDRKTAPPGEVPFKYVGILRLKSLEELYQKDAPSEKFQSFLKKCKQMTSGFHILSGEEIY